MEKNWVITASYSEGSWDETQAWSKDYGPYSLKEAVHIRTQFNLAFVPPKHPVRYTPRFWGLSLRKLEPKTHLDILVDVNRSTDPYDQG